MLLNLKSKLRRKLLALLFSHQNEEFYLRELARKLGEDAGNLSKELAGLEREGFLNVRWRGNQKHYSLNRAYPLYSELEKIVVKTVGTEGAIKQALKNISGVRLAFIFGSFAQEKQNELSDIDLAVVGEIDESKLTKELNQTEMLLGREINYCLFSSNEWKEKRSDPESFASEIYSGLKIILTEQDDELSRSN